MDLLSKASKSGHSAIVSGTMSLVSAYQLRRDDRQRAMKRAMLGVAMMGFGLWQLRRKNKPKSKPEPISKPESRSRSGSRGKRSTS